MFQIHEYRLNALANSIKSVDRCNDSIRITSISLIGALFILHLMYVYIIILIGNNMIRIHKIRIIYYNIILCGLSRGMV